MHVHALGVLKMILLGKVANGEIWASGRSHSIYLDLDLGDCGDLTIRLDDDGKWVADIREVVEGELRRVLIADAVTRGNRQGLGSIGHLMGEQERGRE